MTKFLITAVFPSGKKFVISVYNGKLILIPVLNNRFTDAMSWDTKEDAEMIMLKLRNLLCEPKVDELVDLKIDIETVSAQNLDNHSLDKTLPDCIKN